jgi:hypothetical protein
MKRILRTLLLSLVVLSSTLAVTTVASSALTLSAPVVTIATAKTDVCAGIGLTGGNCGDKGAGVTTVVKGIINILSIIVGIAAVIMIIVGGFKYITSAGDTNGIASAKNTVIYALVGLVIVALAQTIVFFVMGKV